MSIVNNILQHIPKAGSPPLHLWQPELSGVIDIVIKSDGSWWHEGGEIHRQSMVNLFASILRYETDIGFVLVTPVEKWKITVEDAPFIVIATEKRDSDIWFAINIGQAVKLSKNKALMFKTIGDAQVPYVPIRDNLYAKLNRSAYYELIALADTKADTVGVYSDGHFFSL